MWKNAKFRPTISNAFIAALSLRSPCSSTNDFLSLRSKNQSADMDKESLPDIMISPETLANLPLIINFVKRAKKIPAGAPTEIIFTYCI